LLHRGLNGGIDGFFVIGGMRGEGECQGEDEGGWFHENRAEGRYFEQGN
jgi:hypothetical protein